MGLAAASMPVRGWLSGLFRAHTIPQADGSQAVIRAVSILFVFSNSALHCLPSAEIDITGFPMWRQFDYRS